MVFLTLDDLTGGGEVVAQLDLCANARDLCTADRILVIKAASTTSSRARRSDRDRGECVRGVQERTEIKFKLRRGGGRA